MLLKPRTAPIENLNVPSSASDEIMADVKQEQHVTSHYHEKVSNNSKKVCIHNVYRSAVKSNYAGAVDCKW